MARTGHLHRPRPAHEGGGAVNGSAHPLPNRRTVHRLRQPHRVPLCPWSRSCEVPLRGMPVRSSAASACGNQRIECGHPARRHAERQNRALRRLRTPGPRLRSPRLLASPAGGPGVQDMQPEARPGRVATTGSHLNGCAPFAHWPSLPRTAEAHFPPVQCHEERRHTSSALGVDLARSASAGRAFLCEPGRTPTAPARRSRGGSCRALFFCRNG